MVEINLGWSGPRGHRGENAGWEETGQSWREHRVKRGFAFRMRVMTAHLSAEEKIWWRKCREEKDDVGRSPGGSEGIGIW